MADGWFPEARIDRGNNAGPYTDNGEPKGLLHTTEGKNYAGARQAYAVNNSWPHATCTFENGRFEIFQHTSVFVASRALRNLAGGVQTNRDRVVQLEIVGTADRHKAATWGTQYVENFPDAYLDGIARWMRWVNATLGVPNRCPLTFKAYPESYGANGVRLTASAFDAYSGWLGHQHAPENTHGDPGLIDIRYLLVAAAGPAPIPEPVPQGDDGMFAYDRQHGDTKVLVVVAAGKQTRMIGATVAASIRGADYYFGLLDKQNVDWVDANYGPVKGL